MTISGKKITGCLWILRVLSNDFQQTKRNLMEFQAKIFAISMA
jgi:hypothetical protein